MPRGDRNTLLNRLRQDITNNMSNENQHLFVQNLTEQVQIEEDISQEVIEELSESTIVESPQMITENFRIRPTRPIWTNAFEEPIMNKEFIKELKDDDTVKLYLGGLAKVKDCIQTVCGRWFKKGDNHVVHCVFNNKPFYIEDCQRVISNFKTDGIGNINKINKYVFRGNINNLCTIIFKNSEGDIYHESVVYEDIPTEHYKECIQDGFFYHEDIFPKEPLQGIYRKVNAIKDCKTLSLNEQYKYGFKSPMFSRLEGKQYTFGVELETCLGVLPAYLDKELTYEAVHDGSLRDPDTGDVIGAEYVTGVLTGDTGLLQLKRLCFELTKRCKVNKRCGYHVHLGKPDGSGFNKQTIVFMYKLFRLVESEILSVLPPSRRNNEYCRRLGKIEINFKEEDFNDMVEYKALIDKYYNEIVKFVGSTDSVSSSVNKKKEHPMGHKCGYNHGSARYCWANFVPTIFNTRGNGVYTINKTVA